LLATTAREGGSVGNAGAFTDRTYKPDRLLETEFMETTRFILILALSLVAMMLWQAWQEDYGVPVSSSESRDVKQESDKPDIQIEDDEVISAQDVVSETPIAVVAQPEKKLEATQPLVISTDVFYLEINPRGGGIQKVKLLNYPVQAGHPEEPFELMDSSPKLLYITQGGLLSKLPAPTHEDLYSVSSHNHSLEAGKDVLQVPLVWSSKEGVKVTKIFEFTRASYLITIRYVVENDSGTSWQGRSYHQIKRSAPNGGRSLIVTYTGAVISSPEERYEKIDFDDMQDQKLERDISNGWAAMLQHYFVSAILPVDKQQAHRFYTKSLANERYVIGAITPAQTIEPGNKGQIEEQLYIGPKILKDLEKIAEGLELTVDYGVLWFIAKPLFKVLDKLHDLTNNWGWSIILVTIILKLIFFPLSAAGYKSMANMRRVQPRMLAIKERYKDDKSRLNQAMMQIYKEEKINPLGGCFPILVQIPVFIALYWVLLESVEMRQATFALWLQDLSSPDPFYVLPLLMGATMFIQQKLNPAPMDPVQAKVMSILPIAFTVFFAFFPSGLVLYWVVNNILSIAQQWQITRSLERAGITSKS
jgi:YidC/Oxa1 family membrane protein insertase